MVRTRAASPVKKWKPAPKEWVEVFTEAAGDLSGAEQRKMFGYPAAFVNGNMFASLHEVGLVLRLPDAASESFLRLPGSSRFEPMPGRVMREYVVAPESLAGKPADVRGWLRKAFTYGASLPAKAGARSRRLSR